MSEYTRTMNKTNMISQTQLEYGVDSKQIYMFDKYQNKMTYSMWESSLECEVLGNFLYFKYEKLVMLKISKVTEQTRIPNMLYVENDLIKGGKIIIPRSHKKKALSLLNNSTEKFHIIVTAGRTEYHIGYGIINTDTTGNVETINSREECYFEFYIMNKSDLDINEKTTDNNKTPRFDEIFEPCKRKRNSNVTMYNGRSYDSQTEALWGLFFDNIGKKHTEAGSFPNIKVYDESNRSIYTPDFWIVGNDVEFVKGYKMNAIVEIKPYEPTEKAKCRCEDVARRHPGLLVVLIYGNPICPFESNNSSLNGVKESYRCFAYYNNETESDYDNMCIGENLIFVHEGCNIYLDKQHGTNDKRWEGVCKFYNELKRAKFDVLCEQTGERELVIY